MLGRPEGGSFSELKRGEPNLCSWFRARKDALPLCPNPSRPASSVIWRWKQDTRSIPGRAWAAPVIQSAVAGVAALLLAARGNAMGATMLAVVALSILTAGLALPKAFGRFTSLMRRSGTWAGEALSAAVLVPIYFLLFAPIALWFRLKGKDCLHRAFPSIEVSLWQNRPQRSLGEKDYRRQY